MASRKLTASELAAARDILNHVRQNITETAKGDPMLTFALRRYVYKYLAYDERGTPAQRTRLKLQKLIEQGGKCGDPNCLFLDRLMTKADDKIERYD